MENKNIKRFTRIEKLGFTLMIIGTTILVIAIMIAALMTNILCGIAFSGVVLAMLGGIIAAIYSSKEE